MDEIVTEGPAETDKSRGKQGKGNQKQSPGNPRSHGDGKRPDIACNVDENLLKQSTGLDPQTARRMLTARSRPEKPGATMPSSVNDGENIQKCWKEKGRIASPLILRIQNIRFSFM